MITKEELLQKGIDPAEVDTIISALEAGQGEDSSLIALQKALGNEDKMDSLFKAKGGKEKGESDEDEDGDDEEYDEKFMKKHKKFMKKLGKGEDGKDDKEPDNDEDDKGMMFGKMKKAIDDIDPNAEGAIVEMAELSPTLNALVGTIQDMKKAISGLNRKIEVISEQNQASFSLMSKAAAVQVETAETISGIAKTPAGRKGVVIGDMAKATQVSGINASPKVIWNVLAKAINAGDMKAGDIGSKFESSGMNVNLLNAEEQKFVSELIAKEAN